MITDNFRWCWHNGVIDTDLLLLFGEENLWRHRIYVRGHHQINLQESANIFLCGSSQATVETWGSSQATVETRESSILRNKTTRQVYIPKSKGWEIVLYEETEPKS